MRADILTQHPGSLGLAAQSGLGVVSFVAHTGVIDLYRCSIVIGTAAFGCDACLTQAICSLPLFNGKFQSTLTEDERFQILLNLLAGSSNLIVTYVCIEIFMSLLVYIRRKLPRQIF
jgi:hypothetical protein